MGSVSFWRRRTAPSASQGKVAALAAKMPTSELWNWASAAVNATGASFDQWRFHDGPPEEVELCLSTLGVLFAELRARQ